jgi:hypothetical protein
VDKVLPQNHASDADLASPAVAGSIGGFYESALRALHYAVSGKPFDTVLLSVREALSEFADRMSHQVGAACRATLLDVWAEPSSNELMVAPRATSSGSIAVPQREASPTPLDVHLELSKTFFESASAGIFDLDKAVGGSTNSHDRDRTSQYRAVIVWPVMSPAQPDQPRVWEVQGFLCLDTMMPNVFVADRDLSVGMPLAGLLHAVLAVTTANRR